MGFLRGRVWNGRTGAKLLAEHLSMCGTEESEAGAELPTKQKELKYSSSTD